MAPAGNIPVLFVQAGVETIHADRPMVASPVHPSEPAREARPPVIVTSKCKVCKAPAYIGTGRLQVLSASREQTFCSPPRGMSSRPPTRRAITYAIEYAAAAIAASWRLNAVVTGAARRCCPDYQSQPQSEYPAPRR